MEKLAQISAIVAILANAVVYGTDAFCAIVQRPALANVDDRALTSVMGQVHRYGDRRMPIPGVVGLIATLVTVVAAATVHGKGAAVAATAVAGVALLVWLAIYARISAPVNKRLTAAAEAGVTPDDARALQRTWDAVINSRAALQGLALLGLCVALVVL